MPFPNPFDDHAGAVKSRVAAFYVILVCANAAAWIWAFVAFADRPVLIGAAFLAYVFGLRHAFDADHIAAIDNVVRKLMQEGKRPLAAGFYFSLGHSTIVVLASAAIAATAAAMQDRLADFKAVSGTFGTLVSACFLLAIGLVNLVVLKGIWAAFRRARNGENIGAEALDALLSGRGFFTRLLRPLLRGVTRSWHLYPIGFLFGLGFDTATEIGLLGISAAQAAQGMSFWTIMIFPALFTAGMTLVDTTDSILMVGAYGWAFIHPIRKLWYNLTITAASVAVAFLIGGIEALGLIGDKLQLAGPFWRLMADLNDNLTNFGFAVAAVFVLSWIVSIAVYRWKRYDDLPASAE
ncbi:HoxN/HupN/NixA family nickel/cobalt transporter [Methylocapsa polymorpha]|uniref:Nickel/cobalt efflux system n=1 Tax=Methylocapsa polymorpha TaxID=3080828 RepID=A0ABZ0HWT4_9HYPH|nr:HoxN/HupN/NixA family nickel/cobalt transporter [Methylocapsa sp. RX1]